MRQNLNEEKMNVIDLYQYSPPHIDMIMLSLRLKSLDLSIL